MGRERGAPGPEEGGPTGTAERGQGHLEKDGGRTTRMGLATENAEMQVRFARRQGGQREV
ncbi:hypothetical protein P7K49_006086 [Saguinus oedipus]|uniref:Uncharacterized protein n=1 Tax=Saguinus oedipus TaxID=9490 RepID=A0ABQ9W1D6_SAGOE|nr:hypothetical protein P7K49_006086 [Saguinus oedipus]